VLTCRELHTEKQKKESALGGNIVIPDFYISFFKKYVDLLIIINDSINSKKGNKIYK
jgi:hypothetical protein